MIDYEANDSKSSQTPRTAGTADRFHLKRDGEGSDSAVPRHFRRFEMTYLLEQSAIDSDYPTPTTTPLRKTNGAVFSSEPRNWYFIARSAFATSQVPQPMPRVTTRLRQTFAQARYNHNHPDRVRNGPTYQPMRHPRRQFHRLARLHQNHPGWFVAWSRYHPYC
jgi:hypothetical protein